MKEKKFYQVLVIILVVLNISIISFFLLNKSTPPERTRPRMETMGMLERRLDLSQSQKHTLDSLRSNHFTQIRYIQKNLMKYKRALYQEVRSKQMDQERVDSLTYELGRLHQRMERINFHHFREIRQQLQPQQAARYDSLLSKIFRRDPPRRGFGHRRNLN
ncbi:MAG: Spy/CpxP family protein refolding chaperone [Cyclobacteriaceae bacterium]